MNGMRRRKMLKTERRAVYRKTGGRCAYCGCEMKFKEMQVDHVLPLSRGGADEYDNMLPACRSCNHRKGASSIESFRRQMERAPSVLARDNATYRNAVRYGLVRPNPHKVKFYFEKPEEEL